MKSTKAKKTFEAYRSQIRELILFLKKRELAGNDIATIDNVIIIKFFDSLIKERRLAGRTVEKYQVKISSFFKHLISRKILKKNPVYGIEKPEAGEDFYATPFLDEDIEKILPVTRTENPQLFLAALLQYFTFIRPGDELLKLKVSKSILQHVRFLFLVMLQKITECPYH